MTGKSFLIFCLLVTAAFSQFNLTGFLLNSKTKTPTVPPAPATSSSTSSSSTTTTPKSTSSPPPSSEGDTGAFAP
jgi:cytoskeletal protein RodZ